MRSCLSIYLGKTLEVDSMTVEDVWTKGCICPGCYDNIYLVNRGGEIKYLAHYPRKPEYRMPCTYRVESLSQRLETIKRAKGETNRTVEKFHRYFRRIIDAFIPEGEVYQHRDRCNASTDRASGISVERGLERIILAWKDSNGLISNYSLQLINMVKTNNQEFLDPKDSPKIKKLFDKASRCGKQTFIVLCIIKYLGQSRARVHLQALFLYLNYITYAHAVKGENKYYIGDIDLNIKSTLFYIINLIIFCPWSELAERLEKGLPTDDLATDEIPYFDLPEEVLDQAFTLYQ